MCTALFGVFLSSWVGSDFLESLDVPMQMECWRFKSVVRFCLYLHSATNRHHFR